MNKLKNKASLKVITNEPQIKEHKSEIYERALLRLSKKLGDKLEVTDRDNLKKYIFLLTKFIIHSLDFRNANVLPVDSDSTMERFAVMDAIMSLYAKLTPDELVNMFPIKKEYKGEKYQMKDYFSTMEAIGTYPPDKSIGMDNIMSLLWDYVNKDTRLFLMEHTSAMSDLYRIQSGKGIMQEYLEHEGVDTYSMNEQEGILVNNRTGECSKISKTKKRKPKQFDVIK